jgi:hypothetical protein
MGFVAKDCNAMGYQNIRIALMELPLLNAIRRKAGEDELEKV